MKQYSEQAMKDVDSDRISSGRRRLPSAKFVLRWLLIGFCVAVWFAVAFAVFFIW